MATERSRVTASSTERPSLGEETRAVVRARIVDGASAVLAERGFDATIDEIATAAGVSRRTVFRHFPTHGAVVEAAVSDLLSRYVRSVDQMSPASGAELGSWLEETAALLHSVNRRLIGRAFWDINLERSGCTPAQHEKLRIEAASQIAHHAWHLGRVKGKPPSWVVDAFTLQLSCFATSCLEGYDTNEAGKVSARILAAVLSAAMVEAQAPSSKRSGSQQ